jgi:uncharacterized membrane protein
VIALGERQDASWIAGLQEESARWVKEALIGEEHRRAILARYPDSPAESRDRTTLILSLLGSILVGAGVILFFAANWPVIPAWIKVGVIFTTVLGAYGAGYYLQFVSGTYPRLGHGLILLGGILYGAAIWLIAQIFHLESRYPNGFLFWGLGLLPLVWVTSSRPLLYLGTGLLTIWTVMEQAEFRSYNYLYPILVTGALLPLSHRLGAVLAQAAALVGPLLWFLLNVGQHTAAFNGWEMMLVGRICLLFGAAVFTAGLAKWGDERAYLGVGAVVTLLGTYLLTFRQEGRLFAGNNWSEQMPSLLSGSPFLWVGLGVILAAWATGLFFYTRRSESGSLTLGLVTVVPVLASFGAHLPDTFSRMVIFNLLLFAGSIGLVMLGIQRQRELLLNLGLLSFVVLLITRYVDLLSDAMETSLFFVLGGMLLLGGGWFLERNRRRWVQSWGGDAS